MHIKADADYIFYELTRSICPDCRRVMGKIVDDGDASNHAPNFHAPFDTGKSLQCLQTYRHRHTGMARSGKSG